VAAWCTAALLLLLPLFAMQITDQVAWEMGDFAVFGALLIGVGVTFELAAKRTGNTAYRAAVGVALAAVFFLLVVNGAVGIIGASHDDANLMYVGVLAVAIIGTAVGRFKPLGMARAMLTAAVAQALVAMIALVAGWGSAGPIWPWDILGLTLLFAALWLGSAWLFRQAARERPLEVTPPSR
jgi:hypothetical protein